MPPENTITPEPPSLPEINCTIPRIEDVVQRSRLFLLSEFLLIFIGLPLGLFLGLTRSLPPLPIL